MAVPPALRTAGRWVFAATLLLFLLTLSPVFYPGESAQMVAERIGVAVFPAMSHSVWGWCIQALAAAPVASAALRLNAFSAVCGAFAAWLVFQVVARIRHDRTFEEAMARFPSVSAQVFSGAVAALVFATSLPVWIASTRAHPLSFDLALGLLPFYLLLRYGESRRLFHLYASVLLYGIGITEYETMIPMAPVYGVMLLVAVYRAGHWRLAVLARAAGLGFAGLLLYVVAAWQYTQSPAYEWRAFENFFQVLLYIWREQYVTLTRSMPRVGWLIVGMVSVAPWLVVVGFRGLGARPTGRGAWSGTFILNGLLSALAVGLLFNFTLSPWSLTRGNPLLAAPHLFIAMWAGYVAGYWYVMLSRRNRGGDAGRSRLAGLYAAAVVALVAAAAAPNVSLAHGRSGAVAARFAEEQLDSLRGRTWMVTAGELGDNIALAAWERGLSLRMLNPRYAQSASYGRYVASLFDDARSKSLARVGLVPLLNEWLRRDPAVAEKLAIVNAPDLWLEAGLRPLPVRTLFLGEAPDAETDVDALVADFHRFWDDYGAQVRATLGRESFVQILNRQIAGHLGKMANNLGVYAEDRGRPDLAYRLYQDARAMDTNNLSALINQHALAKREGRPELEAVEADLTAAVKKLQSRMQIWALSYHHGYIRSPELYATRGWAWAMSGKPNMAMTDMKRAVELGGETAGSQLAMAGLYFAQEMSDESREAYLSVLEEHPDNAVALLGLARLATRSGDFDSARGYLARLRELKAPAPVVAMEEAIIEAMTGNAKAALSRLADLVKEQPDNLRAWGALAVLAAQAGDQRQLQAALEKLQAAKMVSPSIRMAMAQIAANQNDLPSARKHLEEVLRVQPGSVAALEAMLRLCVAEGRRDEAERYVEALITVDPRNAFGNYILGALQYYREQYALAESSYRVSLASKRSPEVLNDLAWLLRRRGALDEALVMVRESLDLDDRSGSAWDTYGAIMMAQNRLDEAEKALQRALALRPDSAPVTLNVALLYEKKGQYKDAQRLAESLMARPTELSREQYDDLRDLMKRLRMQT